MNVIMLGAFPEESKARLSASFPAGWTVYIAEPEKAEPFFPAAEVLIPEHIPVNRTLLDKLPSLKLVQTGAGYDNVDMEECTKRGVMVCNAKGLNANAVAEHTMALILAWHKNIVLLDTFMKERRADDELYYSGAELAGKTIGIIGLGAIGQRVASLSNAFGLRVIGFDHHPKSVPGVQNVRLDELLAESDIISLHVPANGEAKHLINRQTLEKMKPSALLVNTARGAIVDEEDLVNALTEHHIAGACLDVFAQEPLGLNSRLRDFPNVILTPHTAGLPDGVKFHAKRQAFFVSNIQKLLNNEIPDNLLNEQCLQVRKKR